jgi:hypothetical protein
MKALTFALPFFSIVFSSAVKADDTTVKTDPYSDTFLPLSETEVETIFKEIPPQCIFYGCKLTKGGYEKGKDVKQISKAIAQLARSKREAVQMAVYGAYETNSNLNAEGDKDKPHHSYGAWQINVRRNSAVEQLKYWKFVRDASIKLCKNNKPEEQLAALASGSCRRGKVITRNREKAVAQVLDRLSARDASN